MYCGIDLHINNHLLVITDERDRVVVRRRLANELERTLAVLEPYRDQLQGVAIESTPNWYWLFDGLNDHGYPVQLVNVLKVKQYGGLKHTDDEDDARHLAHLMRLGILPTVEVLPPELRRLRDLMRRRGQLVRTRSSCWHRQSNLLSRETGWSGRVRDQPCPAWSSPALALNWAVTDQLVVTVDEQIRRIEEFIRPWLKADRRFELVRTIGGVGLVLAATIVTETGPIERFKGPGNYASYARLVDATRWSNDKLKGRNNRKAGNAYLSWAFHEAAHYACRWQDGARRFYQRKLSKTNALVAIRALARKLARATFYILRDQVPYDEKRLFH